MRQVLLPLVLGLTATALVFVACSSDTTSDDSGVAGSSAAAGSGTSSGGSGAQAGTGGAAGTSGTSTGGSAGSGTGGATAGQAGSTNGGTGGSPSNGGGGSGPSAGGGSGGASFALIVNEISGKGDDWVELLNTGTVTLDIGGYGIADDSSGAPDLGSALTFAQGTSVPPGMRVLVVGDHKDGGVPNTPETDCVDGGPSMCFWVSWKISSTSGDAVYILGPDQSVLSSAPYPMEAVPSGQTWGRLPDGTGAFAPNQPTPGAANQAP